MKASSTRCAAQSSLSLSFHLLQLFVLRGGTRALAARTAELGRCFLGRGLSRSAALDHDQAGVLEILPGVDLRLLPPGFLPDRLGLRLQALRLGVRRLRVLGLLLALRLQLVDASLSLDDRRIDMRGDLLAALAAVAVASPAAPAAAISLVAVALGPLAALGARVAGVRARKLRLRVRIALGHRVRLLLMMRLALLLRLLLSLLLRSLSVLLVAVGARTAIRPSIVALLAVVALAVALATVALLLAIAPLLEAALLLAVAVLVATAIAAPVATAIAAAATPAIATVATVLMALLAMLLSRCLDRSGGGGCRRDRLSEQPAEQAAEESTPRLRGRRLSTLGEADRALEELPVLIDEHHERNRYAERARREPGETIKAFLGRCID